jgi:DNA-binding CsgD family transcriptional regulator
MTRLAASDIAAVATFARDLDERAVDGVASEAALDSMLALVRADTIEWGVSDEPNQQIVEIRHYPPLLILRANEPALAAGNAPFWATRKACPLCGPVRVRNTGAIRMSDLADMSGAHPQHHVCAGIPVAHQLNLFMRPGDILTRHVAFSRADGIDFDERDGQLLELAGVFIVQQARMLEARQDAQAAIAAFETMPDEVTRGLIVIRGSGRSPLVSGVARHLLGKYFAWNPGSRRLPEVVQRWLDETAVLELRNIRRGALQPLRRATASGELVLRTIAHEGQLLVILDETTFAFADPRSVLTARERDVLDGVAEGLTNTQIADRLSLSPATVGKHLENAFAKLGVHTRARAVALTRSTQGPLSRRLS